MQALSLPLAALALWAASSCVSAQDQPAESAPRPNVVLFLADDVGWNAVGYHGDLVETPRIDALVSEGVELDAFYVQPLCTPTRAALLTGRYPIRYGLQFGVLRPWTPGGLDLEEVLLPEVLRDAGYQTAICGKWHLGFDEEAYLPTSRGFEHQYGCYTGSVDYKRHERMHAPDWHRDDRPNHDRGHATTLIGRECKRLIRERDPERPFFLYVPFTAAHGPLQPPKPYLDRYRERLSSGETAAYAALIAHMDEVIGGVLDLLDEEGLREDTLVLFLSDNGGQQEVGKIANSPLRGRKGDLYEGGVRVPAVARWPGVLPAGLRVTAPMHVVDLFPTLLRLAGAQPPAGVALDGVDQWEVLTGASPGVREELLLGSNHVTAGIRVGAYKLLRRTTPKGRDRYQLYDVVADPAEQEDLAAERPELVARLRERLAAYAAEAVPERVLTSSNDPPEGFVPPDEWGPPGEKRGRKHGPKRAASGRPPRR